MMHEKAIWKPGIGEIAKASKDKDNATRRGGDGGVTAPHMSPQLQDAHWVMAYFHWVMAYFHKTQLFMKNGGQQKCLDKALFW